MSNIPVATPSFEQKLPDKLAREAAIELEVRKFQEGIVQLLQMSAARGPHPSVVVPPRTPVMYGNPAALGWGAFAMSMFMLSCFLTGLLDDTAIGIALPLALFYGGLAQIIAGVWEYAVANTFHATAFISYGAFWLSFASFQQNVVPWWTVRGLSQFSLDQALGVYLLGWFIFTSYMLLGSLRVSKTLFAFFVCLEMTFMLLFISAFADSVRTRRAGAWFGILTAAAAWYASAASLINASWRQNLVPTIPYVHAQQGDPYMHGQPEDPYLHGHKNAVYAHGQHSGPAPGASGGSSDPYGQPGSYVQGHQQQQQGMPSV